MRADGHSCVMLRQWPQMAMSKLRTGETMPPRFRRLHDPAVAGVLEEGELRGHPEAARAKSRLRENS